MKVYYTDAMIQLAAQGNEEAWTQLYNKLKPFVQSIVRTIVGSVGSIDEDLVQETFLKVFLHIGQYRREAQFTSWLYRVTANVCLDYIRKQSIEPDMAPMEVALNVSETGHEDATISRIDLERLLDMLAPGQREKLVMYDIYGLSHREISEHTGVKPDTSRHHYHQARRRAEQIAGD